MKGEDAMAWVIDNPHSYVGFAIKHMMFTTVRGQFRDYRASIDLNSNDLTRSRFAGEIEVASIDTREPKRDEHLRSPEFFDVERFPTICYQSGRIEALSGNRFRVYGTLTIRGISQEVVVEGNYAGGPYKDPAGVMRTGFSATGIVHRRDYGLNWNIGLETGGVLVGEDVTLQLDIELMWENGAPT